ncbi:MAG: hypothetical protein ACOX88_05120 [Christensenellales bacterium]|jgi:hypothetical protein
MKLEKIVQVVNAVLLLTHSLGGEDFHVDIEKGQADYLFTLRTQITELPEEKLKELSDCLSIDRQREIEPYWRIDYDSKNPVEPSLLGMMLDEAKVDYDGRELVITGRRKDA